MKAETRKKLNEEYQINYNRDILGKVSEKFTIIKGYVTGSKKITLKCNKCGKEFTIGANYCKKLVEDNKLPNCPDCEYKNVLSHSQRFSKEQVERNIKDLFGEDKFDFSKSQYSGNRAKSIFICKDCGSEFIRSPFCLMQEGRRAMYDPCPVCNMNKIKEVHKAEAVKNWINKSIEVHGKDEYDYTLASEEYVNNTTPVHIYDKKLNEYFLQRPIDHSTKGHGNPNRSLSKGEQYVSEWLSSKSINFEFDKRIEGVISGKNTNIVRIDFIFIYNNVEYWIEYNGKQHYEFEERYHSNPESTLEKQIQRDNNVREYCKNSNKIFIEIPYIIKTFSEVSDFLDKTVIKGVDPETLIDYKNLYK